MPCPWFHVPTEALLLPLWLLVIVQVAPLSGTLCGLVCGTRQVLGGTAARHIASGRQLSYTWSRYVGFDGGGSSSSSGIRSCVC